MPNSNVKGLACAAIQLPQLCKRDVYELYLNNIHRTNGAQVAHVIHSRNLERFSSNASVLSTASTQQPSQIAAALHASSPTLRRLVTMSVAAATEAAAIQSHSYDVYAGNAVPQCLVNYNNVQSDESMDDGEDSNDSDSNARTEYASIASGNDETVSVNASTVSESSSYTGENELYLSKRTFFKLWRLEFKHVTCPKFKDFSQCTECKEHRKNIYEAKGNVAMARLRDEYQKHMAFAMQQRVGYHSRRSKAMDSGNGNVVSIIVDGADQNKTAIPKESRASKATSSAERLNLRLMGAKSHGHPQINFLTPVLPNFGKGSNMTVQVINDLMCEVFQRRTKSKHKLPLGVLYVQLDNAASDNKNRYVFAFLGLFVLYDLVTRVYISFLPVGHTHEDIDGLFGNLSQRLRDKEVNTLSEMKTQLRTLTEGVECVVDQLRSCVDFKRYIEPHVNSKFVEGMSKPHYFELSKLTGDSVDNVAPIQPHQRYPHHIPLTSRQNVYVRYKHSDTEEKTWKPETLGEIPLFVSRPDATGPGAMPLIPIDNATLSNVQRTVETLHRSRLLSDTELQEWQDEIIQPERNRQAATCQTCHTIQQTIRSCQTSVNNTSDRNAMVRKERDRAQRELVTHLNEMQKDLRPAIRELHPIADNWLFADPQYDSMTRWKEQQAAEACARARLDTNADFQVQPLPHRELHLGPRTEDELAELGVDPGTNYLAMTGHHPQLPAMGQSRATNCYLPTGPVQVGSWCIVEVPHCDWPNTPFMLVQCKEILNNTTMKAVWYWPAVDKKWNKRAHPVHPYHAETAEEQENRKGQLWQASDRQIGDDEWAKRSAVVSDVTDDWVMMPDSTGRVYGTADDVRFDAILTQGFTLDPATMQPSRARPTQAVAGRIPRAVLNTIRAMKCSRYRGTKKVLMARAAFEARQSGDISMGESDASAAVSISDAWSDACSDAASSTAKIRTRRQPRKPAKQLAPTRSGLRSSDADFETTDGSAGWTTHGSETEDDGTSSDDDAAANTPAHVSTVTAAGTRDQRLRRRQEQMMLTMPESDVGSDASRRRRPVTNLTVTAASSVAAVAAAVTAAVTVVAPVPALNRGSRRNRGLRSDTDGSDARSDANSSGAEVDRRSQRRHGRKRVRLGSDADSGAEHDSSVPGVTVVSGTSGSGIPDDNGTGQPCSPPPLPHNTTLVRRSRRNSNAEEQHNNDQ